MEKLALSVHVYIPVLTAEARFIYNQARSFNI